MTVERATDESIAERRAMLIEASSTFQDARDLASMQFAAGIVAGVADFALKELQAERRRADQLRNLLWEFVDDEPCDLDHEGSCKEHWCSTGEECANAAGRRLLGMEEVG